MKPKDYNELNQLLADFSEASNQLADIEANVNQRSLSAARTLLPQHAEIKSRLADIEAKIKTIALANQELFADDKKTHATPFGAVSFRASTWLQVDDEEKAILKIEAACHQEFLRATKAKEPPRFTVETLIRTRKEPNLEALEKFGDVELVLFGVQRIHEEKFSVKPLEVKADKLAKKEKGPGSLKEAA